MKQWVKFALALLSLVALGCATQSSDEIALLRKELQVVREELKSLRAAAPTVPQQPPQPGTFSASVDGAPVKGGKDARVTLIEYSDYQCPFCGRHFRETFPELRKEYIDTGKVRHVFRDYPIEQIHPQALKAAEAARCAEDQGQYWEMHDLIFGNQRAMAVKDLTENARALGLNSQTFQQCLDGGKYTTKIRMDLEDGKKFGVSATPTFFLGLTDPQSTEVKVLRIIRGAQPYQAFKEAIDGLLSQNN